VNRRRPRGARDNRRRRRSAASRKQVPQSGVSSSITAAPCPQRVQ